MLLLKYLLFLLFETMQIIVQTPQGLIKGKEQRYNEEWYNQYAKTFERINTAPFFCFDTEVGKCYINKSMIDQSVFFLVK
jgi:hypothetical protein